MMDGCSTGFGEELVGSGRREGFGQKRAAELHLGGFILLGIGRCL
jgi:hypothetical protein